MLLCLSPISTGRQSTERLEGRAKTGPDVLGTTSSRAFDNDAANIIEGKSAGAAKPDARANVTRPDSVLLLLLLPRSVFLPNADVSTAFRMCPLEGKP